MREWHWRDEHGQEQGPCTADELRQLAAAGSISAVTLVWRHGWSQWHPAGKVRGLFQAESSSPTPPPLPTAFGNDDSASRAVEAARAQAAYFWSDLRGISFHEEVFPLNEVVLRTILSSYVFWSIALLGGVPLLISTLSPELQLTAFAIYFAALWGVIFKSWVVPLSGHWRILLGAAGFTGVIGVILHSIVNGLFVPAWFQAMPFSDLAVLRLLGSVLHTGLSEEITKSLPVVAYVLWQRGKADPTLVVLLGIFSGLSFAAMENIDYANRQVHNTFGLMVDYGVEGLIHGTVTAMQVVMLRSMSLVFCHAVFSGVVGYFLAVAAKSGRRWLALYLVGIAVAATLHGLYNWFWSIQPTFSAGIAMLAFVLFYAYVANLHNMLATHAPPAELVLDDSPPVAD